MIFVGRYKKGFEAKRNLVEAAKKLFYEKGLTQTTIVEICNLADASPKNFHYYFNSKYDLANAIQSDFLVTTYVYVDLHYTGPLNSVKRNVFSAMLHYHVILNDEHNKAYYYEILKNRTIYSYIGNNIRRIYEQFNKEFHLGFTREDLRFAILADLGVRRELVLEYMIGEIQMDVTSFVTRLYTLTAKLFDLDKTLIQEYIQEASIFVKEADLSEIKLLI